MLLRASDEKKSPRSSTQQENLKAAALEAGADMSHKTGGEWEELEPYFILILGTSLFLGFTLIYFNQATVLVRSLATVSAGGKHSHPYSHISKDTCISTSRFTRSLIPACV